jgi:hypothetical protein
MEGQRSYEETLDALSAADILVLFDSPGRRIGVPGKLYEYLGAGRPILALAEPDGDTAAILRSSGVMHRIAPPRDAVQIGRAIAGLVMEMRSARAVADPALLRRFTREELTRSLASHLDALIGERIDIAPAEMDQSVSLQQAPAR